MEARRDFRGGRRESRVGVARRRGGHRVRSCGASLGANALPSVRAGGDTRRARAEVCGDESRLGKFPSAGSKRPREFLAHFLDGACPAKELENRGLRKGDVGHVGETKRRPVVFS